MGQKREKGSDVLGTWLTFLIEGNLPHGWFI